jgi:hypothetical protein
MTLHVIRDGYLTHREKFVDRAPLTAAFWDFLAHRLNSRQRPKIGEVFVCLTPPCAAADFHTRRKYRVGGVSYREAQESVTTVAILTALDLRRAFDELAVMQTEPILIETIACMQAILGADFAVLPPG